jgi:hypothetical protein
VEGKLFCALHKIMETGELFLVYRECDEDRSNEAAIGEGGGAHSAPLCKLVSSKRRVREAHARPKPTSPVIFLSVVVAER